MPQSPEGSSLPILIVDDDVATLSLLTERFADEGLPVVTALDGQAARSLLHHLPVALVLTDFMMPRESGVDLAHAIQRDPRIAHTPVILMSAAPPPHTAHLFVAVIHKPFDLETLLHVVYRFI